MSPCVCAKRGDQNSAIVRVCFIGVYVFAFAATFNTVFFFSLVNQTSFKDEFPLAAFFFDDQFFDILGAPKFAEQLNGAMSTHVRKLWEK
jgi:hypothetical protein